MAFWIVKACTLRGRRDPDFIIEICTSISMDSDIL